MTIQQGFWDLHSIAHDHGWRSVGETALTHPAHPGHLLYLHINDATWSHESHGRYPHVSGHSMQRRDVHGTGRGSFSLSDHLKSFHGVKESAMEENFSSLLGKVIEGKPTSKVIEQLGVGPDRVDDIHSADDKDAAFQELVGRYATAVPYVDGGWVGRIADQLRTGTDAGELAQMASINRDQYVGSARVDAGGSFDTWDVIYRSLISLPTDALPPAPAPLS